jgi:hypothetical protein
VLAAAVWTLGVHAAAHACPLCHSELGEQVRAGIFGATFFTDLLAVLSPFPVLAAVLIALDRIWRSRE